MSYTIYLFIFILPLRGRLLFHVRSFADLFQEDVDLDGEHRGEENKEENEREGDAAGIEVGDSSPRGQHVLDGPGLTAELGHEPAALRGDVGQGHQGDGCPVVPRRQACEPAGRIGHRLRQYPDGGQQSAREDRQEGNVVDQQQQYEEVEDEHAAQTHHDAECPEVDGDIGHDIVFVLDIAIAEVLHVLLEDT